MSKRIIVFSVIFTSLLALAACNKDVAFDSDIAKEAKLVDQKDAPVVAEQKPEVKVTALPKTHYLTLPFAPQAPFADWDDPRKQEGCEEMSVIMVHHYLTGTPLSLEQANEELIALSDWQTANGYPLDVDSVQLAKIIKDYYGYETVIDTDVTTESIKSYIAKGHPVIVPAAGRELGNPYFSGEGPWYHMLVITGFDRYRFITNDPGTKRGKEFKYKHAVLLNAIHDWVGQKERIKEGRPVMLIILPKTPAT